MSKRTVKAKNTDVISIVNHIIEFEKRAQDNKDKLPADLLYIVHRNKSYVGKLFEKYERTRQELISEHLEFDKDGKVVYEKGKKDEDRKVKLKDVDLLTEKINQLLDEDVEITFYQPYKIEEKMENVMVSQETAEQLFTLFDIFSTFGNEQKQKKNGRSKK